MAVRKIVGGTDEQCKSRVFEAVSRHDGLDGVDLRVFLYLSARLGFDECVYVPQLEIATALERRKEHISRAIRKLTETGILISGPKGTRSSEWKLSRDYGR